MGQWNVITFRPSLLSELIETVEDDKAGGLHVADLYCPMTTVIRVRKGIDVIQEVPLFFNYMFLLFDFGRCRLSYQEISDLLGIRFVRTGGKVVTVGDDEIARVRKIEAEILEEKSRMMDDEDYIRRFIGSEASVIDGPLSGMKGTITEVRRPGVFDIAVSIFNRDVVCQVDIDHVKIS